MSVGPVAPAAPPASRFELICSRCSQRGRMVGQTVGHYRIVRKIGQGGMGCVYLAEDLQLDRHVALKTLAESSANPDHIARFEREAKAAAALNHPNILAIHD